MKEKREIERVMRRSDLNHRQHAEIGHALRHADADYTFRSHQRSVGVVYQSARSDLLDLATRGLLLRRKAGQTYHFNPPRDLEERVRELEGHQEADEILAKPQKLSDRPGRT